MCDAVASARHREWCCGPLACKIINDKRNVECAAGVAENFVAFGGWLLQYARFPAGENSGRLTLMSAQAKTLEGLAASLHARVLATGYLELPRSWSAS